MITRNTNRSRDMLTVLLCYTMTSLCDKGTFNILGPFNIQQIVTECQLHTGLKSRHWGRQGELEGLFPGCNSKGEANHKQAKGADCTEDRVMRQKVPEVRKREDSNAINRAIRKLRMYNLGWEMMGKVSYIKKIIKAHEKLIGRKACARSWGGKEISELGNKKDGQWSWPFWPHQEF